MSAQDKADIEKLVAGYAAGGGGPNASVDDLRKVFYNKAAFIGHFPPTNEAGSQFILGDIEGLYGFVSKDAAGPNYEYKITDLLIAKEGDAALVVLEEKDWHGYDFTDYFVALKIGGRWWITAKAFAGNKRGGAPPPTITDADKEEIKKLAEGYAHGAGGPKASVDDLRKVFYDKAFFVGNFPNHDEPGSNLIQADVETFYPMVAPDAAGPKYEFKIDFLHVSQFGDAGVVSIVEKDWHGYDFTDYFLVQKVNGKWWIANKSWSGRKRA